MTKLCRANLSKLRQDIAVPLYGASELKAGILHFGTGNFHRAHQAVYLDRLFNSGKDHEWAIVGTGVRSADRQMYEALRAQDYLTTVVEQEATTSAARVTGPMIEFIPPEDRKAIVTRLADPAIRIVSITVTEGGYFIDPATGTFNPDSPEIAADGEAPEDPKTAFGLIALGLRKRRDNGVKPFTIMCCDNIPHNGAVTRNAVAGVARLSDPGLASWIEDKVAFPNAMVDRITPATGNRERQLLSKDFGIEDNWPVYCEEYIQWVMEDDFCNGRPALEDVGVEFVPDVTPYEFMKIRILNGGHASIAYIGGLLDVHFVHDAMNHPLVGGFFARIEQEEIMATVPPVPGVRLADYYKLIRRRFSNPKIGDTIPRLAFDGSNRQPKFIVPVIADRLAAGQSIDGLALESALWCRYCFGTTESGATIAPNDPHWGKLQAAARAARSSPNSWLQMRDIYGDLANSPSFAGQFATSLRSLWDKGVSATISDYLNSAGLLTDRRPRFGSGV